MLMVEVYPVWASPAISSRRDADGAPRALRLFAKLAAHNSCSLRRHFNTGFRPHPITRKSSHSMLPTAMSVSEVLQKRFSIRAFKDTPVPQKVLEEIFALARHAPSNCNVQPCQAYV